MSLFAINRDPFLQSFFHDPFDFDSHLSRRINEAFAERDESKKSESDNNQVSKNFLPTIRAPRLDIAEDKDNYIIRADVPGMKKEEIAINVKDDILTIEGTRKNHHEEKNETSHVIERSFGKFVRSVRLPNDVDMDHTSASMDQGVLELKIKKAPVQEQVKKITIQ